MTNQNIMEWLPKPKNLWISVFVYTILTGFFVQLILLPHIFPSWQSKRGVSGLLLKMDGQKFHWIALRLSEAIEEKGWSQWELLPEGQLVSGIAAICYVLIYPAPWSVLPVNALLNASACLCIYLILSDLFENHKKALLAALPFIFFPSNLLWNTQFHNENYAVPGVIFILYGWMFMVWKNSKNNSMSSLEALRAMAFIALGSLLLGLVRDYILSGMSYLFLVFSVIMGLYWLFTKVKPPEYIWKLLLVSLACAIMILIHTVVKQKSPDVSDEEEVPKSAKWQQTTWLPKAIDNQLKVLATYRKNFVEIWAHGGSSIDLDVTFRNAGEIIVYTPRATQIAFLSPFPTMWFSEGRNDSGTAMRIASSFEMILIYFLLLGLPIFLKNHRNEPATWMIFFVCTAMLIIYAMVVPNIGALYRFRYHTSCRWFASAWQDGFRFSKIDLSF